MKQLNLILIRHGESQWNQENRFTGWVDVELSEKGIAEAKAAGQAIRKSGLAIKYAYSSVLKRAIRTLWLIQEENDRLWLPVQRTWRLNERHYGALQGLNKKETEEKYGAEQVKLWRRSWDIPPPALQSTDELRADPRYASVDSKDLPLGESLKDTAARVLPFLKAELFPTLEREGTVMVAAHGNSLRAIVKQLKGLSDSDVVNLEIPTGKPWLFELDPSGNLLKDGYLKA